MPLTPKQQLFAAEYLVDFNATRAAIAAGYSKKSARSIGAENLTKPDIQHALVEGREKKLELAQITAREVIQDLIKLKDQCMAEADVKGKIIVKDQDGNPETIDVADRKFSPMAAARVLELLGKHLDMWSENDTSNDLSGVILLPATMTPKEWMAEHFPDS